MAERNQPNNTTTPDYSESIRKISLAGGLNSIASADTMNLYGFNHRMMPWATTRNTDRQGFTFFTRPDLRLSYDNLTKDRTFHLMNTKESESVWRWVRATLSPRRAKVLYPCPFVNNDNPFIPILTNNLESISGWSDVVVDPYTSEAGYYNEQYAQADGFSKDYSVKQLTATFKNQIQDPINRLFYIWTRYSMMVHEGVMDPYLSNIVLNIIDYNTRIYRFVMDSTGQYIQHVAATGAAFPLNSQLSSKFDFSRQLPYSDANDTVSIQFTVMGMLYDDPILLMEFNNLVEAYCPYIVPEKRNGRYVALPLEYAKAMNGRGIPFIDLNTGKLDWYVTVAEFNNMKTLVGDVINGNYNV